MIQINSNMPSILIVEKTGVIKEVCVKTFSQEELYKKAGFKTADNFKSVHSWTMEIDGKSTTISLYGKSTGRAGQENKYDFPPPVDTILFFGSCVLVANVSPDGKTCDDLNTDRWEAIYEALFGGFEDIGDESEEESEDDLDSDVPRTKDGYVKDGFIVDEEDDDYESDEDEYETEEEEPVLQPKTKTSKTKSVKQAKTPAKKKNITVFDKIDTMICPEDMNTFLDCSSELVEEEYE
jgi:hypothetical protein